ncbi:MAG: sulfatase-like hydrolase/transferase [Sphingomonadaceae bacterium]
MKIFTAAPDTATQPLTALLLRASLYLLALFLLCLSYWIHRYFGKPDLHQITYHLKFGAELVRSSDPEFTRRFVRWCVQMPLLLLGLLMLAEPGLRRHLACLQQPWRRPLIILQRRLPALLLLAAIGFWLYDVSALKYATANFGPNYFGTHYVQPGKLALDASRAKNLIVIYVESLETGYANRKVFGRDLLAPLTALRGTSFASYQQAPGTGWTIAALVATQCGVPLERVTIFDGNTQGQMIKSFLGNAVCLPDILAQQGYRNVFMGGGSPTFAGKDKFLAQHHYHEVYGREYWLKTGARERDMNGWGLYDRDLFARAKSKLHQLVSSRQKFNLTVLTVDTHEPAGHLSAGCAQQGYAGFDGVVSCTASEVADFVRYVRDQGYLETTNIVILGDHLARKNPASEQLEPQPHRTIFNAFLSKEPPKPNREQVLHFDMLPTILEFAGVAIPGGRLGLGYSAFNQHPESTPAPDRLDDMDKDLLNRSSEYMALWPTPGADDSNDGNDGDNDPDAALNRH